MMCEALPGFWVKKLPLLILIFALTGTNALFAINVTITPPEFEGTGIYAHLADSLNQLMNEAFCFTFLQDIEDQINGLDEEPTKFIGAFASSSVFASDSASQRGYGGYKKFAATAGLMIGGKVPDSYKDVQTLFSDPTEFWDRMKEEGDLSVGLGAQALSVQIGLNTSEYLVNGLYLGLKAGYLRIDGDVPKLGPASVGALAIGAMGNYQLIGHKLGGPLLWRGINVGTGIVYNRLDLGISYALDSDKTKTNHMVEDSFTGAKVYADVSMKPSIKLDFNVSTIRIPLELMTSVRLLWIFNVALGAGIDLGFGSTVLSASGAIDECRIENMMVDVGGGKVPLTGFTQTKDASISVTMSGMSGPSFLNPKIMLGTGVTLGPVIIDFPVTYYFLSNGFNAGITVGVVW